MLAGGDSIDDVAVLRAGASGSLFDATRAPSRIGSWLQAHKWSNVRQLDAVSRELLARLWAAGAGPADPAGPLTIDIDSTIVAVHGRAKQGAPFGYTKVRGYHPQLATCAQTGQVLMCRLRGGSAGAARGAASFLTETISRVRHAGATSWFSPRPRWSPVTRSRRSPPPWPPCRTWPTCWSPPTPCTASAHTRPSSPPAAGTTCSPSRATSRCCATR